jgi:NAD(P)-dependent dehydrogenase (short-subunit alcohol dehydrogenase family)
MADQPQRVLEDKVVFVSGAAGAIGSVTAATLAAAGAQLVLCDVVDRAAAEVGELQSILSTRAIYCECDVSQEQQVRAVIQQVLDRYGRLDGAANVAGIVGGSQLTYEYSLGSFRHVIEVNLVGTWLCLKYQLSAMLPRHSGAIVNVASIAGHSGEVYRSPYVASKAGVIGLTKTAAVEAAASGVRVNAVSPGPIDTPQYRTNVGPPGSKRYARVFEDVPSQRMGRADDVAKAILWLLSDASDFVVGQEVIVDGGVLAETFASPRLAAALRSPG